MKKTYSLNNIIKETINERPWIEERTIYNNIKSLFAKFEINEDKFKNEKGRY